MRSRAAAVTTGPISLCGSRPEPTRDGLGLGHQRRPSAARPRRPTTTAAEMAMHRSPAEPNAAALRWSDAKSMSASGSTTAWFFAPPRACTRLPFALARSWMYRAIGVEPTNETACDVGVVQDRVDRQLVAVHDVEDAVGQTGLGPQPRHEVGRRGVTLAGLQHEGVAAGDRDGVHPHRDHRREVERRDAGDDAQRLAEGEHVDVGRRLVGVLALQQLRDAAGELDHLEARAAPRRPRPRAPCRARPRRSRRGRRRWSSPARGTRRAPWSGG